MALQFHAVLLQSGCNCPSQDTASGAAAAHGQLWPKIAIFSQEREKKRNRSEPKFSFSDELSAKTDSARFTVSEQTLSLPHLYPSPSPLYVSLGIVKCRGGWGNCMANTYIRPGQTRIRVRVWVRGGELSVTVHRLVFCLPLFNPAFNAILCCVNGFAVCAAIVCETRGLRGDPFRGSTSDRLSGQGQVQY